MMCVRTMPFSCQEPPQGQGGATSRGQFSAPHCVFRFLRPFVCPGTVNGWPARGTGWAYFDASVREAYPWVNNMATGNLLYIYIYIHDRFSSKPRLFAGGYEHVRTTFLANSCLTCAWDERKWPGLVMVRGIHGWNIPVLAEQHTGDAICSEPSGRQQTRDPWCQALVIEDHHPKSQISLNICIVLCIYIHIHTYLYIYIYIMYVCNNVHKRINK